MYNSAFTAENHVSDHTKSTFNGTNLILQLHKPIKNFVFKTARLNVLLVGIFGMQDTFGSSKWKDNTRKLDINVNFLIGMSFK